MTSRTLVYCWLDYESSFTHKRFAIFTSTVIVIHFVFTGPSDIKALPIVVAIPLRGQLEGRLVHLLSRAKRESKKKRLVNLLPQAKRAVKKGD